MKKKINIKSFLNILGRKMFISFISLWMLFLFGIVYLFIPFLYTETQIKSIEEIMKTIIESLCYIILAGLGANAVAKFSRNSTTSRKIDEIEENLPAEPENIYEENTSYNNKTINK
jgi:surface polysaccharide O-acyltransferase-like enzyme